MDGVPAPVAYIDRDERCQYVNRTFLQYFGLTAEQVAELRLRDVVGHGIYAERAGDAVARAARRVDVVRPAGAGRERRAALDDDPRRAGHRAAEARSTARSC